MKKTAAFIAGVLFLQAAFYQTNSSALQRPTLVVGIVIDQMRWDYLYRYYDRYSTGGFKRVLNEGFSCENTFIPYAQTVTGAGHACVYTGSVPAINGMMGNGWYDRSLERNMYCVEDKNVKAIGGSERAEAASPKNLWTTTIGDELRLATNFQSKVISISQKDRGSVLSGGHAANAAYWYDVTSGNWISSTYYMKELPAWVNKFNERKLVDSFYRLNWSTLYPMETYKQSDRDDVIYEGKFVNETKPVFPHQLAVFAGKTYSTITATPFSNTITVELAKSAIENEKLGKDAVTDFLAISFSSPDGVGHQFGPNSIESEDTYLRLDKDLESFFTHLDRKIGKGQYLLFITADHGVVQVPGFLQANKVPAGIYSPSGSEAVKKANEKFGIKNLLLTSANYQAYLNHNAIDSAGLNRKEIKNFLVQELSKDTNILAAFDLENINEANLPEEMKKRFINGYNYKLAGDIQVVMKPNTIAGGRTGTTHGSWYPYDAHIPLLWMGWGVKKGKSNATFYMSDIAPTIAALLHIQMPNGCVGKVIQELISK